MGPSQSDMWIQKYGAWCMNITLTLKKLGFYCSYESSLKMLNNAFYFILKAFFVLKIFNF